MFLSSILVIVGFVFLIKGADLLVDGSSSLAKRYRVSDIAIGLTVVAMGTSTPELVVSFISGSGNHDDAVFANIISSNIFNIFLILGISSVIYPLTVQKNVLSKELPFSLIITVILFVLVNDQMFFQEANDESSRLDGFLLLTIFVFFLYYVFRNMKKSGDVGTDVDEIEIYSNKKTALMIVFGIAGLAIGGKVIVDNAIEIAQHFNVSKKIIGLTILAAGTSLPELATTVVAAFHKKSDLAVGNIVGSNIFNLLLVLGFTSVFNSPLAFDNDLNFDLYVVMVGTTLLFLFMFTLQKCKLDRFEGLIYLVCFLAYSYFLFAYRISESVAS